jgi:hypothetical protein
MMRDIPSIARALILTIAFAWPFGALLYIPVLDVALLPLACGAVVVLAIVDAIKHRERRPSFELAWPVAVAVMLLWFDSEIERPIPFSIGLGLLLAIPQFAHERPFVTTCLRATATGGAVLAALAATSIAIESINAMPAGFFHYVEPPGIRFAPMMTSPEAFWDGALVVLLCVFAAFEGWMRVPRARKAIAVLVFPAVMLVLGILVQRRWMAAPDTPAPSVTHVAFLLVLLWLAARVIAKLILFQREHGSGTKVAPFATGAAFVGLIVLAPHASFPSLLIVPALLAGGVQTVRDTQSRTLPASICMLPAIALLGLNLFHVYPANQDDPRNYEAFLRKDVQENRLDRAWNRVAILRTWHYWEPRACLWIARLTLTFDRPYQAAYEFENAVTNMSSNRSILPPPTQAEIDDFLVRIRDYCSTMPNPNDQYAYERALFAAGKGSSAVALLKQKVRNKPLVDPPLDRDLLVATVRNALDCAVEVVDQSVLTDSELWALLLAWNTSVASNAIPGLEEPLSVVVRFGTTEMSLDVSGSATDWRDSAIYMLVVEGPVQDPLAPLPAAQWDFLTDTGGKPEVRLSLVQSDGDPQAAYHVIDEADALAISVSDSIEPPYPDKPAILVLLP